MLIATQSQTLSNWLKKELDPAFLAYCREEGVVTFAAAGTIASGTVLGKVTASGKYVVSKQAATDGSEVPAAIMWADKVATAAGDVKSIVLFRGPASVSAGGLVLDATYNDATKKAAAYAALEAIGVQVLPTV